MAFVTLKVLLDEGTAILRETSDSPALDAQLLLCHAAGATKLDLLCTPERTVSAPVSKQFHALIARRRAGEPIAYLLGTREFWSMPLRVTPATLIPRPETETLVELALTRIPPDTTATILDLGTGSGAIALAIARERPRARITATDASSEALAVAMHNAQTLHLDNVRFAQGRWFEPLDNARFDVIVSNPPYIAASDPHLTRGDLRFEPISALTCGGDGLSALRHIAQHARSHLSEEGWLLMEHGYDQSTALMTWMRTLGFDNVTDHADLAGIARVVSGQSR